MSGYASSCCTLRLMGAAILLAITAPATQAQRLADLKVGMRLRVSTEDVVRWREGELDTLTTDSLALWQRDQRFVLSRARLVAVEQRGADANQNERVAHGAIVGALVGLAGGGALMLSCHGGVSATGCRLLSLVFAVPAVLAGAGIGAMINGARPLETWAPVQLP
jgi:hypothetical protein